MPSWTHLGLGIGILALLIAGAAKAFPAKNAAGGGSNLRARSAEVEGRRYRIIDRGFGSFEVLSLDDPDAWLVFNDEGIQAQGAHGADVDRDMRKFPSDLFGGDFGKVFGCCP